MIRIFFCVDAQFGEFETGLFSHIFVFLSSCQNEFKGMIFISNNEPDYESFDWCKQFGKKEYESWSERNLGKRKPHEPIAYFETDSTT